MALHLQPGDQYERFRVLEVLGHGAFAWVYKVQTSDGGEPFALKLSLKPVTSADTAKRALREIAVLRSLTNPHVVRIHDSGMNPAGHVYILMDYLQGGQLNHVHDFDVPMPAARAVAVVHQTCLGLAEAHSAGIVHRDVKPENIWILPDESVKLLDFGLARAWDGSTIIGADATIGHMLVGTPHYAQPEQAQTGKLTPASDVYSLATVLYELLTGHTVFHRDRPISQVLEELRDQPIAWLTAHVRGVPVPLRHHPECADLPDALVDVIARSLDKNPAQRPPHAGALANELGAILHHDLGITTAATLRLVHPYGGHEDMALLPGSHRIGSGERCEIRLPQNPGVAALEAVLEWTGLPHLAEIRPLRRDNAVRIGDRTITSRTTIPDDTPFTVGPFRLQIRLPRRD